MRMSELHDVRKRIQQRRYDEPKDKSSFFKVIYRLIMLAMGAAVLTLAFFINDKLGLVDIPKELSNINLGLVSEWIPFEHWFSKEDAKTVNAQPSYSLLKDNEYSNGTNQANLLMDGVVLHVQDGGEGKKGSVSVRHDNGVVATYGHLDSISVKQDERLLKGAVIGSFQEYISIDLLQNNKKIDLNTALKTS